MDPCGAGIQPAVPVFNRRRRFSIGDNQRQPVKR